MNVRMTISISPELSSALTRLALHDGTNISKEVEVYLRENPRVAKFINEIREESDSGALAGSPVKSKGKKKAMETSA
jgi:hypothetical protein